VGGRWFDGGSTVVRKRYVVINGKQILTKGMFGGDLYTFVGTKNIKTKHGDLVLRRDTRCTFYTNIANNSNYAAILEFQQPLQNTPYKQITTIAHLREQSLSDTAALVIVLSSNKCNFVQS